MSSHTPVTQASPETRLTGRKSLFWDIEPERIQTVLQENDHWAIRRIFEHGEIDDVLDCIELYGEKKVTDVLNTSKLGRVAYVMAYFSLGVDPEGRYR